MDNFTHCYICNQDFKSYKGLASHLKQKHSDITTKEYYDRFYKKEGEGVCPVCGKETKFIGRLNRGYSKHCSSKCHNSDKNIIALKKQTIKNNYGDENYRNIEKIKQTKLERYGDENYNNSSKMIITKSGKSQEEWDIMRDKSWETRKALYNNWITEETKQQIKNTKLDRYGDENYNNHEQALKTYIEKYGSSCAFFGNISKEETEVLDYIKSIYTGDVESNNRTILNGKELDIYIPEKKLAFEYDGLYWHNELNKSNNYHIDKTNNCEAQGIQLIHIFEDEWLYKQDIVKSRIKGLLGQNERIFARKCNIKEVSSSDSFAFLEQNHIQGGINSKYRYGLYYNDELVSLMTIGKSRFANEFELHRFCNKLNTNVVGGASRLFKHFLTDHSEITKIISFADRRWSTGKLYEALNFSNREITPPAYYYVINGKRYNRINFQKHKLIAEGYDPNLSEHEIMLQREIYRIYDCGNLKYTYSR